MSRLYLNKMLKDFIAEIFKRAFKKRLESEIFRGPRSPRLVPSNALSMIFFLLTPWDTCWGKASA